MIIPDRIVNVINSTLAINPGSLFTTSGSIVPSA